MTYHFNTVNRRRGAVLRFFPSSAVTLFNVSYHITDKKKPRLFELHGLDAATLLQQLSNFPFFSLIFIDLA